MREVRKGDPHLSLIHWLSDGLIAVGFITIGGAWDVLFKAQRAHRVATTGLYAHLRHPQYVGFIMIMLGFLVQWPTILMLIMFPILVTMYVRLARREEKDALAEFGEEYARYAAHTPAFLPRLLPAESVPAGGRRSPRSRECWDRVACSTLRTC